MLQAVDSIRAIKAAKAGDRVMYFSSDPQTGLLMECRNRTRHDGTLTPEARDADEIAAVAFGLAVLGIARLTQQRVGDVGDYRFNYFITLSQAVSAYDIKRAREIERPGILND